ncbi:MAG TPA: DUF3800 domain-containing protein [Candidatus Sulfotelmatobacter sp.]|nr:DUF3800 domain-containing protein [Candidatus Sulfotelmatobacter sp.]
MSKAIRTHPLTGPVPEKGFAMLQAYIDDSGTHDRAHNCLVAGYWGGVKEWRYFEWQWKQVLLAEGIEEFKANEFWPRLKEKRIGPYKSWTDERHAKFINNLLTIIEQRNITPFACGFLSEEWNKLPELWQRVFSGAKDEAQIKPLAMPLLLSIGNAVHYCKPGKTMHFVVDYDQRISGRMAQVFTRLKQFTRERDGALNMKLGELTFADSREASPLQAADLLAYEAHRWAKAAKGDPDFPMRREYQRAMTHAKSREDFLLFDAKRMQHLLNAMAPVTAPSA